MDGLNTLHESRRAGIRRLAGRIACAALLVVAADARASFVSAVDCLPQHKYFEPGPIQYGSFVLVQVLHFDFSICSNPPQNVGDVTTENFGSQVSATLVGFGSFVAPAQVTVRVERVADLGGVRVFDTEMLQLNLSGGTLPPGVLIRESPTLQSLGQTTITDLGVGGPFLIDSFFDVFTELSLDNGTTWIPSNQPAHVVLVPVPATGALLGFGWIVLAAARRTRIRGARDSG